MTSAPTAIDYCCFSISAGGVRPAVLVWKCGGKVSGRRLPYAFSENGPFKCRTQKAHRPQCVFCLGRFIQLCIDPSFPCVHCVEFRVILVLKCLRQVFNGVYS